MDITKVNRLLESTRRELREDDNQDEREVDSLIASLTNLSASRELRGLDQTYHKLSGFKHLSRVRHLLPLIMHTIDAVAKLNRATNAALESVEGRGN